MADLNERDNGVWGRERGDRAKIELSMPKHRQCIEYSTSYSQIGLHKKKGTIYSVYKNIELRLDSKGPAYKKIILKNLFFLNR